MNNFQIIFMSIIFIILEILLISFILFIFFPNKISILLIIIFSIFRFKSIIPLFKNSKALQNTKNFLIHKYM